MLSRMEVRDAIKQIDLGNSGEISSQGQIRENIKMMGKNAWRKSDKEMKSHAQMAINCGISGGRNLYKSFVKDELDRPAEEYSCTEEIHKWQFWEL